MVSGGVSLPGKRWGRPDDTAGIAGVVNAGVWASWSAMDSRRILGPSRSSRTYYSYAPSSSTHVSFDHQFIAPPAYDADGRPVYVFSASLHRPILSMWQPYPNPYSAITGKAGKLMAMMADDGPHYANNIALMDDGDYRLSYRFEPPSKAGFIRHVDKESGVPDR